jgi:diguanylate cyclase (GGDEF)-like protein/PAS domain S-box-containing protein
MSSANIVPITFATRPDDRLRLAINAMPVAVAWSQLDNGHVEFLNDCFFEMFGLKQSECEDVFSLVAATFADPAHVVRVHGHLRKIIGQNLLERFPLPREDIRCRRKDGSEFYASFGGVVLPEANMSLATFVDITESKEREAALQRIAELDTLTGLFNRRSIEAALSAPDIKRFGLLIIDLDDFKSVNDRFGHHAGDQALKCFSTKLCDVFRLSDIKARLGGDEFAVMLPAPLTHEAIKRTVQRLERSLQDPVVLDENEVLIRFSAGAAIYPDDATNLIDLFRAADAAMYRAKRSRSPSERRL